jgi:hypothetical protein
VEHEGTIESDVFDSSMHTLWGRLSFEAHLNGGQIAIATRSGNLDQPQKNWSPWSAAITAPKGGRVDSPAARFVQWKATLTADSTGHSPELESVDVAYLPKNVEPRVDEIEITPVNYRFSGPGAESDSRTFRSVAEFDAAFAGTPLLTAHGVAAVIGKHHHQSVDAVLQGISGRALAGIRPQWRFPALHGRNQGRK